MIICLDAGHGMQTAGKRTPEYEDGSVILEAEQNYPVMFKTYEYLKHNGFELVMTNVDMNNDMPLSQRVTVANEAKADIFISIHKNAITGEWQNFASGIETFVHKKGYQAERLAQCAQKHLIQETGMVDRGVKEWESLYVTKYTTMPAILVELGFMDYRTEADQMKDPLWHARYARAMTRGICEYFEQEVSFPMESIDHWAQEDYQYLIDQGVDIEQKRFDDAMTRGEAFSLIAHIIKRINAKN